MADYFFDTSALVERHVIEAGSRWVKSLVRAKAGHTLYIGRITAVEVTSAITRAATCRRPFTCSGRGNPRPLPSPSGAAIPRRRVDP